MIQVSKQPDLHISKSGLNLVREILASFLKSDGSNQYGLSIIWSAEGADVLDPQYTKDINDLIVNFPADQARAEINSRIDKYGCNLGPGFLVGIDKINNDNNKLFISVDGLLLNIDVSNYSNKSHDLLDADLSAKKFFMSKYKN